MFGWVGRLTELVEAAVIDTVAVVVDAANVAAVAAMEVSQAVLRRLWEGLVQTTPRERQTVTETERCAVSLNDAAAAVRHRQCSRHAEAEVGADAEVVQAASEEARRRRCERSGATGM